MRNLLPFCHQKFMTDCSKSVSAGYLGYLFWLTCFDSALEHSLETYQSGRRCSKVIECHWNKCPVKHQLDNATLMAFHWIPATSHGLVYCRFVHAVWNVFGPKTIFNIMDKIIQLSAYIRRVTCIRVTRIKCAAKIPYLLCTQWKIT